MKVPILWLKTDNSDLSRSFASGAPNGFFLCLSGVEVLTSNYYLRCISQMQMGRWLLVLWDFVSKGQHFVKLKLKITFSELCTIRLWSLPFVCFCAQKVSKCHKSISFRGRMTFSKPESFTIFFAHRGALVWNLRCTTFINCDGFALL